MHLKLIVLNVKKKWKEMNWVIKRINSEENDRPVTIILH